jgi:DNA polymerase V
VEAARRARLRIRQSRRLLDDLCPPPAAPPTLFGSPSLRSDRLMLAMRMVNTRFDRNTVFPAAMGIERGWKLRTAHHSPRRTTRSDEPLRVWA